MREIKFRVWDINNKEMRSVDLYWFEEEGIREIPGDMQYMYVVMQFTNLRDVNGKEIWEDDIVRWKIDPESELPANYVKAAVGYKRGCWYAVVRMHILGTIERSRRIEVIGNIYENPELLEQDES